VGIIVAVVSGSTLSTGVRADASLARLGSHFSSSRTHTAFRRGRA